MLVERNHVLTKAMETIVVKKKHSEQRKLHGGSAISTIHQ